MRPNIVTVANNCREVAQKKNSNLIIHFDNIYLLPNVYMRNPILAVLDVCTNYWKRNWNKKFGSKTELKNSETKVEFENCKLVFRENNLRNRFQFFSFVVKVSKWKLLQ